MNKKEFNWAILGTGVVANEMANAWKKAGKSIYSVGNRTHSKTVDFAEKCGHNLHNNATQHTYRLYAWGDI